MVLRLKSITLLCLRLLVWGKPQCWTWWGDSYNPRMWWCPQEERGSLATATSPSSTSSRGRLTQHRYNCTSVVWGVELIQHNYVRTIFKHMWTDSRYIKASKGSGNVNLPALFPGVPPASRWLCPESPRTCPQLTESAAWWWPTIQVSPL